jgi:ribosomal protein S18 acetylase RimI-like enzyme
VVLVVRKTIKVAFMKGIMDKSLSYIDYLQRQNALDLAFYPLTVFEKALEERRMISCTDNDEMAGYILHGPVRPGKDTIIYQACVDYDSRRRYLGWDMVKDLIQLCNSGYATGIRLKCASTSESNEFWRMIGFYCTKISEGGVRRSRDINHWRADIQTPLFTMPDIIPSTKPMSSSTYNHLRSNGVVMPSRFSRKHYG